MKKVIRIGTAKAYDRTMNVYCSIKFEGGKLSISGVEGPLSNGDCLGSCGQTQTPVKEIKEYAEGWDKDNHQRFLDEWKAWHLNDMRAGCQHQRAEFDTSKNIELIDYSWSDFFHKTRKQAGNGTLTPKLYKDFQAWAPLVYAATTATSRPKHESPEVKALLEAGLIVEKSRETKAAGWVTEKEHPEGLLSKECPVCGYKYGTAWLSEDVPEDTIDFLFSLPDTDKQPAWV